MISLTFDLDWVEDWILEETINILKMYGLKGTFFATHSSELLRSLDERYFEIALHPNYIIDGNSFDGSSFAKLLKIYPNAKGVRSHTLLFGSRFIGDYEMMGLSYESNCFLFMHQGLGVTPRGKKLKTIPFNWSDDKHIELGLDFSVDCLPALDNVGLNVFNFHPIHIFLNTRNPLHYETAKLDFNKPGLSKHINDGVGVRTLFVSLCKEISNRGIVSKTMMEQLSDD